MFKFLLLLTVSAFTVFPYQDSGYVDDFTLPNVVTGQPFSLKDYDDASTVVVIFTSLYCPFAQLYASRIDGLIDEFQGKSTRFILINPTNPNQHQEDAMENMVRTAQERKLLTPFLVDSQQRVARLLGAKKTPEAIVLSRGDKSFKIIYRGAIDDNPQVEKDVRHTYLRDFLGARQSSKTYSSRSYPAIGCMIKK